MEILPIDLVREILLYTTKQDWKNIFCISRRWYILTKQLITPPPYVFIDCVRKGNLIQLQHLLSFAKRFELYGTNIKQILVQCMIQAARRSDEAILEFLLEHPESDPTYNDNELLCEACKTASIPALSLLLNHPNINATAFGNRLLAIVSAFSNKRLREITPLLLKHNVPCVGKLKQAQDDINLYPQYLRQHKLFLAVLMAYWLANLIVTALTGKYSVHESGSIACGILLPFFTIIPILIKCRKWIIGNRRMVAITIIVAIFVMVSCILLAMGFQKYYFYANSIELVVEDLPKYPTYSVYKLLDGETEEFMLGIAFTQGSLRYVQPIISKYHEYTWDRKLLVHGWLLSTNGYIVPAEDKTMVVARYSGTIGDNDDYYSEAIQSFKDTWLDNDIVNEDRLRYVANLDQEILSGKAMIGSSLALTVIGMSLAVIVWLKSYRTLAFDLSELF